MAENLKVTHYRNGDEIPNVTVNSAWTALSTGAYCYYNNSGSNASNYGALYNWYAVNDSRNIAPSGWHVPSDSEWNTLVNYLGGENVAGGKLKETGTSHWNTPNTGANNESGFTARPGGSRGSSSGSFNDMGHGAYYWSATEFNNGARYRLLYYYNSDLYGSYFSKQGGFSVRLLRDN
jgi:uncharacterized protein (TIGR02145 family)